YLFFLYPLFYFLGIIYLPWNEWSGTSTISYSYFFDVLFVILSIIFLKLSFPFHFDEVKNFSKRILFIIVFAFICIAFINLFSMPTPFHVIERPIIQLLILAPIIEELVYRYIFVACQHRFGFGYKAVAITNSTLFAFAHLLAVSSVPQEFYPFIIFQGLYTFVLSL